MMHGPCGVLNLTNICMNMNANRKDNYLKIFTVKKLVGNDCFSQYKHSDNGITTRAQRQDLNNHWIVPYNLYLVATFDSHINIEICFTIKAFKYLYKYIYKGHACCVQFG